MEYLLLNNKITTLQHYNITKLQNYKITKLQNYKYGITIRQLRNIKGH